MAPFDTPNPHPEAVADAALPAPSLHQHMTAGYEDRIALRREAGFPDGMMITAGDLLHASMRRVDEAAAKAFKTSRVQS